MWPQNKGYLKLTILHRSLTNFSEPSRPLLNHMPVVFGQESALKPIADYEQIPPHAPTVGAIIEHSVLCSTQLREVLAFTYSKF